MDVQTLKPAVSPAFFLVASIFFSLILLLSLYLIFLRLSLSLAYT